MKTKLNELIEEAGHALMVYDTFAHGIPNIVNMKWPDAVISAVEVIEAKDDANRKAALFKLESDLGVLIYKPVEMIAEALLVRVKDVIDTKALFEKMINAKKNEIDNPIEAKNSFISIITSCTTILSATNKIEYPKVPNKIKIYSD